MPLRPQLPFPINGTAHIAGPAFEHVAHARARYLAAADGWAL